MEERTQNFGLVMKESYLFPHLSSISHSSVREIWNEFLGKGVFHLGPEG